MTRLSTDDGAGSGPVITVLIVDDHAVVRRGMRAFFAALPDIEVVGEAGDGRAALAELTLAAAGGRLPDVVVMDLLMPRMDGITAIEQIRSQFPTVQVIAMTSFSETERVHAALGAGASGYLLKDADPDEVAAAVRAAHAGEVHLDPAIARALTREMFAPQQQSAALTSREREVLALVGQGMNNREIADALVISERTARTHVSNILIKLDLTSRTQAALWAVKQGIVGAPS